VKKVYVSKNSNTQAERDLFWAHTGGGGGNYGLITKFFFKELPDAPKGALITTFKFDWKNLTPASLKDILDFYVAFASSKNIEDWNTSFKVMLWHRLHQQSGRNLEFFVHTAYHNDEEHSKARIYHQQIAEVFNGITPVNTSTPPLVKLGGNGAWTGRAILEHPSGNTREIGDFTFYESTQYMNGSGLNRRGKYKSAYVLKEFPQEQVDAIWKNVAAIDAKTGGLPAGDLVDSLIQIDCFGGKINEIPPHDTAMAQRKFVVKCQYQTYWKDVNKDLNHRKWISDFYRDMYEPYGGFPDYKHSSGLFEGTFYNYPDNDLNDLTGSKEGALQQYFLGNLDRLKKVKTVWDPLNYLNHSQSIPLTEVTHEIQERRVEAEKVRNQ